MVNTCYLAVSPDPDRQGNFMVIQQMPCFFIKFGDGSFRDSYLTENPSIKGVENNKSKKKRIEHMDQNNKKIEPRIGKYLEWVYLKHFTNPSSDTEWHMIWVKQQPQQPNFNIEMLRSTLVQLGNALKDMDWGFGPPRSQSVVAFESAMITLLNNCSWN